MAEIAYRSWSLIPRDADPARSRPGVPNPPQMTTVALDRGNSLVFDLDASHPQTVRLMMTTTALSAEGRGHEPVQVYAGDSDDAMAALPATWERTQDGIHLRFSASLSPVRRKVKLHLASGRTLVVVRVGFEG